MISESNSLTILVKILAEEDKNVKPNDGIGACAEYVI